MRQGKFFVYIFFFTMLAGISGCRRELVNFQEMAPEEQFLYAKKFFDKKDYYNAKLQFTRVVMNNSGNPIIEKAQFYLGESYFYNEEYILAIEEFKKLVSSMPQSELADDAVFKIARSYDELSPKYALDQEYTNKAISQYQLFLEEYPNSEFAVEARRRLHALRNRLGMKEFKVGELYRKMGYQRAALISYQTVIDEFYDTDMIDDALYRKGECHISMGDLEDAEKTFQELLTKFPESKYREKAESRLRSIQEELSKYTIKEEK